MKITLKILAVLAMAAASASAVVIDQWDMSGNGAYQYSINGKGLGGHYYTNNHALAQTPDDGTFLYSPNASTGYSGKSSLAAPIDLTAGVVTLSMAFTEVNWSGTPTSNNNIGFRLWESGSSANYFGVEFLGINDRIRSKGVSNQGDGASFGRYGPDLTASGAYNVSIEIDYANNEYRVFADCDWAPAAVQTNSYDFAAAGMTSIGNFQTRYANWSTGDTMLVDDITISQIPEPATLGLVAASCAGLLFVRRRFQL